MKKFLAIMLFALFVGGIFQTAQAFADGSTIGTLTVTKTVLNPQTNSYVKNLTPNDVLYQPGDTITFHITLANNSTAAISQVTLKDMLPQNVDFLSGTGNFDKSTQTLTFVASNVNPKTSQTFAVVGKISDNLQLPRTQQTICETNKVIATFNAQSAQDTSQFCIQNKNQKVFPPLTSGKTTTLPSTGPSMWILLTLLISAILGAYIQKIKFSFDKNL